MTSLTMSAMSPVSVRFGSSPALGAAICASIIGVLSVVASGITCSVSSGCAVVNCSSILVISPPQVIHWPPALAIKESRGIVLIQF